MLRKLLFILILCMPHLLAAAITACAKERPSNSRGFYPSSASDLSKTGPRECLLAQLAAPVLEGTRRNPVARVRVVDPRLTDEDILQIDQEYGVSSIGIEDNRKITDACLPGIFRLKKLECIDLSGCSITGVGFEGPNVPPNLKELNLCNCPLTRVGLEAIGGLPHLKRLFIRNSIPVTDPGSLTGIAKTPVEALSIKQRSLSKDDFNAIGKMKSLGYLELQCELQPWMFKSLNSPRQISLLGCTGFDHACSIELARLKHLRSLWLPVKTNAAELKYLRKRLASCDIQ